MSNKTLPKKKKKLSQSSVMEWIILLLVFPHHTTTTTTYQNKRKKTGHYKYTYSYFSQLDGLLFIFYFLKVSHAVKKEKQKLQLLFSFVKNHFFFLRRKTTNNVVASYRSVKMSTTPTTTKKMFPTKNFFVFGRRRSFVDTALADSMTSHSRLMQAPRRNERRNERNL